jgi:hypothetical protein
MEEKSQEDLVNERNNAKFGSEEYHRAKDSIKDIIGNTNNRQVGNLSNVIKAYKIETDRIIKNNRNLTLVAVSVALTALLIQVIDFFLKYCVFGF